MIKAILLDVDNTLLDFDLSAKQAIKNMFSALSVEYTKDVFPTFLRVNDGLWGKIEKAEMTRKELHQVRWKTVFCELGVNADGAKAEKCFLDELENVAIPVRGAIDAVKYLSERYKLFTASNAPYLQQVKRLKISGIYPYINGILNFEAEGIHKPQRAFFDRCLSELKPIKREEIAIIGDSLSADIKGGKDVGISTVWFDRKNVGADIDKMGNDADNALRRGTPYDRRITDLFELKEIF